MRPLLLSWILPGSALIGLAACGGPAAPGGNGAADNRAAPTATAPAANEALANEAAQSSAPLAPSAAQAAAGQPLSCAADIGAAAAARRVQLCRNVSPATHPPCNAANSCAMIEDEIARSCALFDDDGPVMAGCKPAPKSMEAAAAVVTRYYSAINARDYGTAWTQWGENGRPGQTLAQFEGGFAHTRSTRVTIGRLEPGDGGAGSIYQTVPVTVDSQLENGTRQRFVGDYVLRRVNGVDGASPAQLRWHIGQAKLKAVPAG